MEFIKTVDCIGIDVKIENHFVDFTTHVMYKELKISAYRFIFMQKFSHNQNSFSKLQKKHLASESQNKKFNIGAPWACGLDPRESVSTNQS